MRKTLYLVSCWYFAHVRGRCGKQLGEQGLLLLTSCGQFHRVIFLYVVPRILLGQVPLKLFPELHLLISSHGLYVPSFSASRDFPMTLCRIKFRWTSNFLKYWNGSISH